MARAISGPAGKAGWNIGDPAFLLVLSNLVHDGNLPAACRFLLIILANGEVIGKYYSHTVQNTCFSKQTLYVTDFVRSDARTVIPVKIRSQSRAPAVHL
jgi:hypothetical protein